MNELFATTVADDPADQDGQNALFAELTINPAPAYRVLARKYRPTNFDQLIGQEAMVRTLTNAIDSGRLPHAWMLTGVRGIGKTTTARIIARALNCTGIDGSGGPTIQPCGACEACRTIAEDRNVDVMEMDAASRTSVDDIREIIEGVRYGPAASRYKIYILDEVHMLSKNAFNALLKTLEEPPPHTKFIFATTEIRKVPVTVLSRCQRFDLRRIDSDSLAKHFTEVAQLEKVTAEDEAIKLIALAADGSVRDGLSLLDQAIARGNGAIIAADVKDMLGLADRGQSLTLCRQLMRGEMTEALETFGTMQLGGSDPVQILQDMCDLVHLLTRGQVIANFAAEKTLPEYDHQLLLDLSDIKIPALTRTWQILLKGIHEVQAAPHPAQAAEMVLIRVAYAADLPTPADLIRQLRNAPTSSTTTSTATQGQGEAPTPVASVSPSFPAPRAKVSGSGGAVMHAVASQAIPEAIPDAAAFPAPTNFNEVLALFAEKREGALHAYLFNDAHPVRCEPGILEIRFNNPAAPVNFVSRLSQCLTQWTGQRWMVSLSDKTGGLTLSEIEQAATHKRQIRAMNHPLMQSVMQAFPNAKVTAIRQRTVAPVVVPGDDAPEISDSDLSLGLNEIED